jgi:DNA-binding transcriptional MerR regulator
MMDNVLETAGGAASSHAGRPRLKKAPTAFRTISEVADELHIPQHVLRFWETKFTQVRPLKRGGGRRYYRPNDIALLRRVSELLYIQGYTIKGVQRLLRESGGKLSDDLPPPSPDDREEEETPPPPAARRDPELPIPGLPPAVPPLMRAAGRPRETRAGSEADRLRSILTEMLRELEAIRALLP